MEDQYERGGRRSNTTPRPVQVKPRSDSHEGNEARKSTTSAPSTPRSGRWLTSPRAVGITRRSSYTTAYGSPFAPHHNGSGDAAAGSSGSDSGSNSDISARSLRRLSPDVGGGRRTVTRVMPASHNGQSWPLDDTVSALPASRQEDGALADRVIRLNLSGTGQEQQQPLPLAERGRALSLIQEGGSSFESGAEGARTPSAQSPVAAAALAVRDVDSERSSQPEAAHRTLRDQYSPSKNSSPRPHHQPQSPPAQQMSAQRLPHQQETSHKLYLGQPGQQLPVTPPQKVRGDATFDGTTWSDGWPYNKFRDWDRGADSETVGTAARRAGNTAGSVNNSDGQTTNVPKRTGEGVGSAKNGSMRNAAFRAGAPRDSPHDTALVSRVEAASGQQRVAGSAQLSGRQEAKELAKGLLQQQQRSGAVRPSAMGRQQATGHDLQQQQKPDQRQVLPQPQTIGQWQGRGYEQSVEQQQQARGGARPQSAGQQQAGAIEQPQRQSSRGGGSRKQVAASTQPSRGAPAGIPSGRNKSVSQTDRQSDSQGQQREPSRHLQPSTSDDGSSPLYPTMSLPDDHVGPRVQLGTFGAGLVSFPTSARKTPEQAPQRDTTDPRGTAQRSTAHHGTAQRGVPETTSGQRISKFNLAAQHSTSENTNKSRGNAARHSRQRSFAEDSLPSEVNGRRARQDSSQSNRLGNGATRNAAQSNAIAPGRLDQRPPFDSSPRVVGQSSSQREGGEVRPQFDSRGAPADGLPLPAVEQQLSQSGSRIAVSSENQQLSGVTAQQPSRRGSRDHAPLQNQAVSVMTAQLPSHHGPGPAAESAEQQPSSSAATAPQLSSPFEALANRQFTAESMPSFRAAAGDSSASWLDGTSDVSGIFGQESRGESNYVGSLKEVDGAPPSQQQQQQNITGQQSQGRPAIVPLQQKATGRQPPQQQDAHQRQGWQQPAPLPHIEPPQPHPPHWQDPEQVQQQAQLREWQLQEVRRIQQARDQQWQQQDDLQARGQQGNTALYKNDTSSDTNRKETLGPNQKETVGPDEQGSTAASQQQQMSSTSLIAALQPTQEDLQEAMKHQEQQQQQQPLPSVQTPPQEQPLPLQQQVLPQQAMKDHEQHKVGAEQHLPSAGQALQQARGQQQQQRQQQQQQQEMPMHERQQMLSAQELHQQLPPSMPPQLLQQQARDQQQHQQQQQCKGQQQQQQLPTPFQAPRGMQPQEPRQWQQEPQSQHAMGSQHQQYQHQGPMQQQTRGLQRQQSPQQDPMQQHTRSQQHQPQYQQQQPQYQQQQQQPQQFGTPFGSGIRYQASNHSGASSDFAAASRRPIGGRADMFGFSGLGPSAYSPPSFHVASGMPQTTNSGSGFSKFGTLGRGMGRDYDSGGFDREGFNRPELGRSDFGNSSFARGDFNRPEFGRTSYGSHFERGHTFPGIRADSGGSKPSVGAEFHESRRVGADSGVYDGPGASRSQESFPHSGSARPPTHGADTTRGVDRDSFGASRSQGPREFIPHRNSGHSAMPAAHGMNMHPSVDDSGTPSTPSPRAHQAYTVQSPISPHIRPAFGPGADVSASADVSNDLGSDVRADAPGASGNSCGLGGGYHSTIVTTSPQGAGPVYETTVIERMTSPSESGGKKFFERRTTTSNVNETVTSIEN